jgi:hypothetical protein
MMVIIHDISGARSYVLERMHAVMAAKHHMGLYACDVAD